MGLGSTTPPQKGNTAGSISVTPKTRTDGEQPLQREAAKAKRTFEQTVQPQREAPTARTETKQSQREGQASAKETATNRFRTLQAKYLNQSFKSPVMCDIHAMNVTAAPGDMHPLTFAASMADEDTMYLHEAMRQHDKSQFLQAMKDELDTHTKRGHWTVVPRKMVPKGHKVLRAVWSMKRKS